MTKALIETKNQEFALECAGVLSNLILPDLDWAEIFKHFKMMDWVKKTLISNSTEPDLVLQVIINNRFPFFTTRIV